MPQLVTNAQGLQITGYAGQQDRNGQWRYDADESIFLQRELRERLPSVFEAKPEVNFREIFPLRGSIPDWANDVDFATIATRGEAKVLGSGASDVPIVNASAKDASVPYLTVGAGVLYTREELIKASKMGMSLDTALLVAARRAIEEKVNKIAWEGDLDAGLVGLLRHPSVQASDAANALDGSTTAAQCLSVLNAGADAIPNNTQEVESPDTLILPPDSYRYIAQLQNSVASNDTVESFWRTTNGMVSRVMKARELKNAKLLAAGAETTTDAAVFGRFTPDVIELPYSGIVQDPIYQCGPRSYLILLTAKVGSVILRRPQAIHIVRGV